MAINNEKLLAIVDAIKDRGVRQALISGTQSDLLTLIPKPSQMVHNETGGYIAFGDGITATPRVPARITQFIEEGNNNPPRAVEILWRRLNRWSIPGELLKVLLPPQMTELFREGKPDNFSFLEGETLTENSSFRDEWINAPSGAGRFMRVRDSRKPEEGSVDSNSWVEVEAVYQLRELGSQQNDQLEAHIHTKGGSYLVPPGPAHRWNTDDYNVVTSLSFSTPKYGPYGEGFADETRPKNHTVLYLWKTYDELEEVASWF